MALVTNMPKKKGKVREGGREGGGSLGSGQRWCSTQGLGDGQGVVRSKQGPAPLQDCVKAAEQGMSERATQAAFRQKHLETSVWAQSMVIRTSQSSATCGNQATFCHVSPQQGSGLGCELCHRLALLENQCQHGDSSSPRLAEM